VTAAQELANDLHRQLDLAIAERDQAVLDRDQAQAEADAMATSLRSFGAWLTAEHAKLRHIGGPVARTLARVLRRYEMIEGTE
jgi:hypothetical protein